MLNDKRGIKLVKSYMGNYRIKNLVCVFPEKCIEKDVQKDFIDSNVVKRHINQL